jgi:hypothetical protein
LANTHIKLWAGRNTHERFGSDFQKRRLNDLTVSEASLHSRHVLTYRIKQTTR